MLERLAVKWGWGGQTTSFAPDVILSAGYVNEWSIFLSQSRSQKFNRRTLWKIAQNRKRSSYIYLLQCFNKMIHTYGEKNDWSAETSIAKGYCILYTVNLPLVNMLRQRGMRGVSFKKIFEYLRKNPTSFSCLRS